MRFPTLRSKLSISLLAIGLLGSLTLPSLAEESKETASTRFIWNFAAIELIEKGNAKNGQAIAKKEKCAKCHGDTGISDEDDTPSIAGQVASYNFKQMMDYKDGTRDEKTMTKRVRDLSPQDISDLSAWYATQKPEPSLSKGKNPPLLVTTGDMKRLLIACGTCHGKEGKGYGYESPALTGQKRTHFIDIMMAFKDGDRENDHYRRMRFIASQLTEKEIETLADYYAAKPTEEDD